MKEGLLIRTGEIRDLKILVDFTRSMAYETERKELPLEIVTIGVKTLLENSNLGFYLLAEKNGEAAGSLMVTTEWSDWYNGLYWWLQSVYILPKFRHQGVYSKLYAFVKAKAKTEQNHLKICGFRLYVDCHNTSAQSAYENLGMKETRYKIYEEL